jgi:hypothetical protein
MALMRMMTATPRMMTSKWMKNNKTNLKMIW